MSGYVRMGRGGAGNHIPKEELQKQVSIQPLGPSLSR